MAKTPCFQCRGPGFDLWSGNWIPHAAAKTQHSQRNNFFFFKSCQRCNKPGLGLASSGNQKYLELWSLRGKNQDVLVQLCSVAESCPAVCNPMDCSAGPSIAVHSNKFVLLILCVSMGTCAHYM